MRYFRLRVARHRGGRENALAGSGLYGGWPAVAFQREPGPWHSARMDAPDPATLPLRNQILDACGHCDVNHAAHALVDSLMILLIASAPNIDAAERSVIAIGADMRANIRRAFEEYHAMREGLRETRQ
jgi:hypothetical protein